MENLRQSNSTAITPLETLVVQQLAEMLREERALQEQYKALRRTAKSEHAMKIFSGELSKFEQRAERLFRLMQAMEECCPRFDEKTADSEFLQ